MRSQMIIDGAQSGLTQNKYRKLLELPSNVIKYIYSVWTYGQNFEILKFSAAPETHFKSIFKFGGTNLTFVG